MAGEIFYVKNHRMQLVDPKLIKGKEVLKYLIQWFYPVWVGPYLFRVLRKGKIPDYELFRAVLNGKQVYLHGTVSKENALKAQQEKEAEDKAQLEQEIRNMLN